MSFDIGFWDRLFWAKMAVVVLAPRAPRTHRHGWRERVLQNP